MSPSVLNPPLSITPRTEPEARGATSVLPPPPAAGARHQTAAAITAALVAIAVFAGILVWLHNNSQPAAASPTAGDSQVAAVPPGVIGTGSSQSPEVVSPDSLQSNGSAGAAPDASVDSPLQIYWRPATAEYFVENPSIQTAAVHIPNGFSASLIRVDIENTGPVPIQVQPNAFMLTAPGAYAQLSRQRLPGLLSPAVVSGHSSLKGWLLFVKPWWDVTPDGQRVMVRLAYNAPPGARINLSNRAAGQSPAHAVPSSSTGAWPARPAETGYSI